jgi:hypothetical protein
MRRTSAAVVIAALLSTALPTAPSYAETAKTDAIVWTGPRCSIKDDQPQNRLVAALLGLVLEPLIEAGIKGVGDALKKAGAPSDIHVTGSKSTYMYAMNSDPVSATRPVSPTADLENHCILVAFGPAAKDRKVDGKTVGLPLDKVLDDTFQLDPSVRPQIESVLDSSRMTVVVVRIEPSKDGTAFALVPDYVRLGSAIRHGSATAKRTIAVTFSLFPPGANPDGTATAVRTIAFEDVTDAKTLPLADAAALATDWMPLPAIPDAAKTRATNAAKRIDDLAALQASRNKPGLKQSQIAKIDSDIARLNALISSDKLFPVAPVTWRADFHETGGGSKLLVALGGFLSGKAADIAKPIADSIDPTKAETRAQANDQLRVDAITDTAAYNKALVAGDVAVTRVALIKAQGSCRRLEAAGFAEPDCSLLPQP